MNRAEKAKATIDNEYVNEAFEVLTKSCHNVIEESMHNEEALREDMYYMLRAIKCLKGVFMAHIREGKAQDLKNANIKRIKR